VTINDSRLRQGTLTLGPTATALDMSCQITNCRVTSSYSDDGNAATTLCGDSLPAPRKLDGRHLEGTFIQDFDVAETEGGVVAWISTHDLQAVAYEFVPDDVGAPTIAGNLVIEWPSDMFGGDVNTRVTSDFSWSLQGDPTITWGTPANGQTVEAAA
jgi:hypothetical protein